MGMCTHTHTCFPNTWVCAPAYIFSHSLLSNSTHVHTHAGTYRVLTVCPWAFLEYGKYVRIVHKTRIASFNIAPHRAPFLNSLPSPTVAMKLSGSLSMPATEITWRVKPAPSAVSSMILLLTLVPWPSMKKVGVWAPVPSSVYRRILAGRDGLGFT